MKKVISIILISAMMLSVVACGGGTTARETADSQASVTKETMKDVKSDIPFQWSFISNDGSREVYEVKVDKGYSPDTNFDYSVWYGKEDAPQSFMVKMKCSLAELKEGVQVGVPLGQVALLQDNNVAGVLRITEVDTNSGDGIQVASQVDEQDNKQETVHEKQPKDEPSRNDENKDQNNDQQENENLTPKTQNEIDPAKKAEEIARSFGDEYVEMISSDSKTIGLPAYVADGILYRDYAKAFGLSENLRYIVNPKTNDDHINNLMYIMLTGNYEFVIDEKSLNGAQWTSKDVSENAEISLQGQAIVHCDLMGAFMNSCNSRICFKDGHYYIKTSGLEPSLTVSEIHQQSIDVYLFAKQLKNDFYQKGKIKPEYSDYEKAKVYSDWFVGLKVQRSGLDVAPNKSLELMRYDSAYAALINRRGDCGSKASAFTMLMRMEGITSYGAHCGGAPDNRTGHIDSWMLLDDEEYLFEFNMQIGLVKLDKSDNHIEDVRYKYVVYLNKCYFNLLLKTAGLPYNAYELDSRNGYFTGKD